MATRKKRAPIRRRRRTVRKKSGVGGFIQFFVDNWYFLTIIFGLVLALMYHILELKQAHETIKEFAKTTEVIKTDISGIKEDMSLVKGKFEVVSTSIQGIIVNTPELGNRLKTLEEKVGINFTPNVKQGGSASNK